MNSLCGFLTVTQIRHFIQILYNLLDAFAPHFNDFTTLLQFPPHFYNLLHTGIFFFMFAIYFICCNFPYSFIFFIIFSTLLYFSPHFYKILHDLSIFSVYNVFLTFKIDSTLLQFDLNLSNYLHTFMTFTNVTPYVENFSPK